MVEQFLQEIMNVTGGAPSLSEMISGKLIRFATSDKRGDENGWCRLFEDLEGGVFGCWRQGISGNWKVKKNRTPQQRAYFNEKVKQAREEAGKIEAEQQAQCRSWCAEAWKNAKDATCENPYLKRKGVKAYGLKSFRDTLLVPVYDLEGVMQGIQFISPDGSKKFKTGTNKSGNFFKIGKSRDKTIVVCEGYATGASIHQATGHAVVIAFDAGNLLPVAMGIRSKFSDMKFIIAADDDYATAGNPGLTKATEAAQKVGGTLAIPKFPDTRGLKDTDFNDLAMLAGVDAVKSCIETASLPASLAVKETASHQETEQHHDPLDETVARLVVLSPLQYDQVRKAEAKSIGVRPVTLDMAVKTARKGNCKSEMPFTETEPWDEPVDPAQLLTEIAITIRRFIICEQETSHTVALWIAMTWFIDIIQVAPLAVITAPEKRCGKSQLLFLLGKMSARAITASSISSAALFRTIDAWCPTLLIDEADAFMKDNEELRGLLNSGHTRDSAYVIRTVGENFTPTKFNTWGAKALAGIGHVADTLMDRAVTLELRRKLPHEEVDRIRYAEPGLFDVLRSKLARFAEDYSEQVRDARPNLPQNLNDRAQDNWEPLLAIAMTAGGEWTKLATAAALKLSGNENPTQTIGTELLADIQEIFAVKNVEKIFTADLIKALCADDEKPWATYNRGLPIKPRQISAKLKGYGIHSDSTRIGYDTAKGYKKEQFTEAFSRYIPVTHSSSVTTSQPASTADLSVTDNTSRNRCEIGNVTGKAASILNCDVVTDRNPLLPSNIFNLTGTDFEVKV